MIGRGMQGRTKSDSGLFEKKKAKQLLGQKDGEEFWKISPAFTEQSSRLEQRKAIESAIREAAEVLRNHAI